MNIEGGLLSFQMFGGIGGVVGVEESIVGKLLWGFGSFCSLSLRLLDLLITDCTFNSLDNHAIKTGTLHNEQVGYREVVACVCGLWSWVGLAGLRGASGRVAGLRGASGRVAGLRAVQSDRIVRINPIRSDPNQIRSNCTNYIRSDLKQNPNPIQICSD
ncbi:hypothetical protein WN943_009596 [Citrus x changshan-huyou]